MTETLNDLSWIGTVHSDEKTIEIASIYKRIPSSRCPATCSACCQLSDDDRRKNLAVMYPLRRIEYFQIARYVQDFFPAEEAARLFSFREEWPQRCVFLDLATNGCRIYPARPYPCRTYGVLSRQDIASAQSHFAKELPTAWLEEFARDELRLVCPDILEVTVAQKPAYIAERAAGLDVRRLNRLNLPEQLHPRESSGEVERLTGKREIGIWTWGGFNALFASSDAWFASHFADYWQQAVLAE